MSYQDAAYRITGVCEMLWHNGQLADPFNYYAKELKKITEKRKKTDADHERVAEIEFLGSLYLDSEKRPIIPAAMMEGCLIEAAKRKRKAPIVRAGVICDQGFLLEYDGPRDPREMWASGAFRHVTGVRVGKGRVMRTRAQFPPGWWANIRLAYLPEVIDRRELDELMALAGQQIGLGDWRPRYGRFQVEIMSTSRARKNVDNAQLAMV